MPAGEETEVLRNLSAVEEAEQRAFARGQASAEMKGQIESHERRLNVINGTIERGTQTTRALAQEISDLRVAFEKSIAIAATRAEEAKNAAEAQVSTRTFVLGLVGAVSAIGVLLAGIGHA